MMHALTLAAWLASMAAGPALPAIAATSTTGTNTTGTAELTTTVEKTPGTAGSTTVENATGTAGSTAVENAPGTAGSTAVANTTERAAGAKRPRVYVLAIGNNASPIDEPSLAPLQYADDDAVRFYERFEGFAATRYLLTVFDPQTERRLAQISAPSGARVSPPTVRNLSNAIDALQHKLQTDRTQNIESVVYIYYSGHGSTGQDGEPYLALIDGTITQDQLFNGMIDRLDADRIHVLIDACNAGAVVGLRGPFDEATEARRSPQPLVQLAGRAKLDRRPHVGIIVAATAGQAAHEWSRLESGIFTHQVLSALAGGGDVNADGRVEYSELHAFVGAANSGLPPHAQARVVAVAPAADRRIALIDLAWLQPGPFLVGQAQDRFYIERDDGQRWLDMNLSPGTPFVLALPPQRAIYIRTETTEAFVAPQTRGAIAFGQLPFKDVQAKQRGALDAQLRRGLFDRPYGPAYYRGFIDSRGLLSVDFAADPFAPRLIDSETTSTRRILTLSSWIAAATALAAAGVAGAVALERRQAFNRATQRDAVDIAQAYDVSRNVAAGSLITAGIFASLGTVLWLTDDAPVSITAAPLAEGWTGSLTWHGHF